MGIRIDVAWRWWCWCRNTYSVHKDRSEPMRTVWKPIGEMLGGIYRSMKNSSTILPGHAARTLSKTKLDRWCLAVADLTPWMNSLIRPWLRKLQMSTTWRYSSSNSSRNHSNSNSLQTRVPKAANVATGHPFLNLPTPPAAADPAYPDQMNTANQAAEDNHQAYRQPHWSQPKSSKDGFLLANVYNADPWTTRRASALYTR